MLGKMARSPPPTTVRAARGAGRSRHFTSVFQGSPKRATIHASSGVIWGIPGQSSMPAAIAFLRNRVGSTTPVERRFAAALAAIHIAAFAIMLWSEVDVVAKTTFVLAWGFLNFFWLAVLGRPPIGRTVARDDRRPHSAFAIQARHSFHDGKLRRCHDHRRQPLPFPVHVV